MGDKKFTLAEFHLHSDEGVQFGPGSIGGETEADSSDADATGTNPAADDGAAESGGRSIAPLLAVLALVGIAAVVARKLLSVEFDEDGGEPIEVEV